MRVAKSIAEAIGRCYRCNSNDILLETDDDFRFIDTDNKGPSEIEYICTCDTCYNEWRVHVKFTYDIKDFYIVN